LITVRQPDKFRGDRSNVCRDKAIYHFFQNGNNPSSCLVYRPTHEEYLMTFIIVQNLVAIDEYKLR